MEKFCFDIFGVDNILLLHAEYRKKDILVLGGEQTDGLDGTSRIAKTKYSVNITKSRIKIGSSLHYNVANTFLYANGVKI